MDWHWKHSKKRGHQFRTSQYQHQNRDWPELTEHNYCLLLFHEKDLQLYVRNLVGQFLLISLLLNNIYIG